jgi:hypothetical protein
MRFAYVVVAEDPRSEEGARAKLAKALDGSSRGASGLHLVGGGTPAGAPLNLPYLTGQVAAAIAADAYTEDEDECEALSKLLLESAIK